MLVESAVNLIGTIVYWPGWVFTAVDHTNRFEGSIKLRIDYPARETGRENARHGYPETITTYATFPIVVDKLDDVGLWREVMRCICQIDQHEAREAFRIGPTLWAPFHPHAVDGMERWGDPRGDLLFGIA
jgi:hypothetical protein